MSDLLDAAVTMHDRIETVLEHCAMALGRGDFALLHELLVEADALVITGVVVDAEDEDEIGRRREAKRRRMVPSPPDVA